jgi:hypothetical protein
VPLNRPISKNALIATCARNGLGKNSARDTIEELVEAGQLYVWEKPRSGTQPEKFLARVPQPTDAAGKEIFTETFTVNLAHEHLRESPRGETFTCSHPSLEGVKVSPRESHEKEHESLPEPELAGREDLRPEDQCPSPPAGLFSDPLLAERKSRDLITTLASSPATMEDARRFLQRQSTAKIQQNLTSEQSPAE